MRRGQGQIPVGDTSPEVSTHCLFGVASSMSMMSEAISGLAASSRAARSSMTLANPKVVTTMSMLTVIGHSFRPGFLPLKALILPRDSPASRQGSPDQFRIREMGEAAPEF